MNYEPELGQAIFGGPWEEQNTPGYVTAGLDVLAERIAEYRGKEAFLTSNDGEPEFATPVFIMRTYCWCDGRDHPDGCPPNFESGDISARWYKHAQRGASINRDVSAEEWAQVLSECLASVPSGKCVHQRVPKHHPWATDNAAFNGYWECGRCGTYGFESDAS